MQADPRSVATFLRDAAPPQVGTLIVQPELAHTLEEIAADGAETFYRGALARRLAEALPECGTLITEADLAEFQAEKQQPIGIDYRGLRGAPGPAELDRLRRPPGTEDRRKLRSCRGWVLVPPTSCMSWSRPRSWPSPTASAGAATHARSSRHSTSSSRPNTAPASPARIDMRRAAPTPSLADAAGDTTYFCTADGEGNAVSGIQSINSGFGSGVMAGDTGILLNNRMAYWHLDPNHPNYLRPGRRVRHTMNPPLVLKHGKLWGVFGTPGADNQVQINFQIATAMIDFGLDPQQAAEMPRWTSMVPGQYANYPHDGPDVLTMERRFSDAMRRDLARRGHPVDAVGDLDGPCSVEIIRRDGEMLLAGSDPRRDGWALAW